MFETTLTESQEEQATVARASIHTVRDWDADTLRRRWLMSLGPAAPLLVPGVFAVLLFGF